MVCCLAVGGRLSSTPSLCLDGSMLLGSSTKQEKSFKSFKKNPKKLINHISVKMVVSKIPFDSSLALGYAPCMSLLLPEEAGALQSELLSAFEKGDVSQVGRALYKIRKLAKLTVEEFCREVGFSTTSYHRYINHKQMPKKVIVDFLGNHPLNEDCNLHSSHVGVARTCSLKELYLRHANSKEVWAFKHQLPFMGGLEGEARTTITNLLKEDDNLVLNFVLLAPDEVKIIHAPEKISEASARDYPAFYSFCAFKAALHMKEDRKVAERLKGWAVKNEELAFKLGIPNSPTGIVIDLDVPLSDIKPGTLWREQHDAYIETKIIPRDKQTKEDIAWLPLPSLEVERLVSKLLSNKGYFKEKDDGKAPVQPIFYGYDQVKYEHIFLPSDFRTLF